MDIELLKTFLEVRRTRHFGKAAESLYLTQAAVSARIRQLEQRLGVKLFTRNRNNIQLTAEGERLVPHAESMMQAWSVARLAVAEGTEPGWQLRLGVHAGLWNSVLQKRLQRLYRRSPALSLQLRGLPSQAAAQLLEEQALDLLFTCDQPTRSELQQQQLGVLDLHLYCSQAGVDVESALGEKYLYLDWGIDFGRFHARHFAETSPPRLHTDMALPVRDLLLESGGAAYLPASLVRGHGRTLRRVKQAPTYSATLQAVWWANSEMQELIETVVENFSGVVI
jgi:DNA-binding transcriptional LysR family regulator